MGSGEGDAAMTATWGPAYDAEIAYRHEQVRAGFAHRRPSAGHRPIRMFAGRLFNRRSAEATAAPHPGQGTARPAPTVPIQTIAATAERDARAASSRTRTTSSATAASSATEATERARRAA